MDNLPTQAGIDDRIHAIDGHAGLGDVGAEQDLGAIRGRHGGLLSLEGEAAMERKQAQPVPFRQRCKAAQTGSDFRRAGEKDQRMPRKPLSDYRFQGRRHLEGHGPVIGAGQVAQLH